MKQQMKAYHFDLKRGLWTRDYMAGMTDILKSWGYNTIFVEIEDKFRFRKHPAISAPDAFSHEAMHSFVSDCEKKGLDVIPLIQSLGHAECVVGKPEYAHLRETPETTNQYDSLSQEAGALIKELFDEIIDVMEPKEFFHMGGDETRSLGKSEKARQIAAESGLGTLYLRHMLPIFEHLHKRGLRPMIWADICMSHPEIIEQIPDYVVMVEWNYKITGPRSERIIIRGGLESGPEGDSGYVDWKEYKERAGTGFFRKHMEQYAVDGQTEKDGTFLSFYCADALRALGVKDILPASANGSSGDLAGIPLSSVHIPNCFYTAQKGIQDEMGFLVTSWVVRHSHNEVRYPGTFAAVQGAVGVPFDFNKICLAFTGDFYGIELPDFSHAILAAEPAFPTGEAQLLVKAKKSLVAGGDYFNELINESVADAGGKKEFIDRLSGFREKYIEAGRLFRKMSAQAVKNRANFDFWLEGIDLNVFYADFTITVLEGLTKECLSDFNMRLEKLESNTRRLFAPTFTKEGLDLEMEARYGFHKLYTAEDRRLHKPGAGPFGNLVL